MKDRILTNIKKDLTKLRVEVARLEDLTKTVKSLTNKQLQDTFNIVTEFMG